MRCEWIYYASLPKTIDQKEPCGFEKDFFSSICFIDVASKIGSNKFVWAAENQRLEGILSGREKFWDSVGRFCENEQIWGAIKNYVIESDFIIFNSN